MNNESTDRLSIDANQDKPRIILRDQVSLTTSTIPVVGSVFNATTFDLTSIKISGNTLVEVYMKDNQTNYVYNVPFVTGNSSGQFVLNAAYRISTRVYSGNQVQSIELRVLKKGGATTDTYTFYIVVYSTKISDDLV
jgi:hypothetical protein